MYGLSSGNVLDQPSIFGLNGCRVFFFFLIILKNLTYTKKNILH